MTHPLLTPRYMVEADYPNSPFRVGDILHRHIYLESDDTYYVYAKVPNNFNIVLHDYIDDDVIVKYPHIFRPMHWSEQRELGEMPRWVVANLYTKHRVYPVEYSVSDGHLFIRVVGDIEWSDLETACNDWKLTPATEAEYLEYLKSKEK